MANGALGRPKAADLVNRCSAKNAHGGQCGNPAMHGVQICQVHLGRTDPKKLVAVSDRLVELTELALNRLEQIIRTGTDDVAERATRTVLDRTAPKPGAQNAIIVNLGGGKAGADASRDPSEIIQRRLAELAAASTEREEMRYSATDPGEWPGEIIDAEIVEAS